VGANLGKNIIVSYMRGGTKEQNVLSIREVEEERGEKNDADTQFPVEEGTQLAL